MLFPNRFCLATYWKVSLGPKQCNCSIGILAGSKHWGTVPQTLTNHQTAVSQPGESPHQNLYGICSTTDTNQSTPIGSGIDTPGEAQCLHCLQPLCAYTGSFQPVHFVHLNKMHEFYSCSSHFSAALEITVQSALLQLCALLLEGKSSARAWYAALTIRAGCLKR